MSEPVPNLHQPRMSEIRRAVCDYYGLSEIDLLSERRFRKISRPRQIAMWLAKNMTTRSFPEIARQLRRSDHTTIMYGVQAIDNLIERQPETIADLHAIKRRIHNRVMLREALEQSMAAA